MCTAPRVYPHHRLVVFVCKEFIFTISPPPSRLFHVWCGDKHSLYIAGIGHSLYILSLHGWIAPLPKAVPRGENWLLLLLFNVGAYTSLIGCPLIALQTGEEAATHGVAPGAELPASLRQAMIAELAKIASPTNSGPVFAAAQPSTRAPASQPPTPQAAAMDTDTQKAGLFENMEFAELDVDGEPVAPPVCADSLNIAMKPDR